ncbi:Cyclic di-GMP phosphodiesterase response regulator RpfG [Anaerolineales bacterium]|nr:Cyclic di-GMP phosphodiesterase response regulator RpfG [Anaerolineales bacterium]
MLHAFNDLIFIVDQDGVILEHKSGNPFQITDFPLNFLKRKLQDLLSADANQKIATGLHELRRKKNAVQFEFSIPTFSGKNWYESRLAPTSNRQIVVLIRDITKYKQSEEIIESQLEQLATLRTIDLAITSGADLNQTLSMILDYVQKHLRVDAASVLLFNLQTQRLDFAAGAGFRTPALRHTHLRIGEGLAGQAAQERTIVHIPDLKKCKTELLRSAIFSEENFVVYYAVPLIAREQILGVLEIFHRSALTAKQEWENFLHTLAGQASIAIDNAMMLKDLQRSNVELTLAYDKTIDGWSRALNLRDKETEDHTRRVTDLTLRLARRMRIPESELIHIRRGSTLHDIGKVAIPDHILLKPAPLTKEEWNIMRRHPLIAAEILKPISYLTPAIPIPRFHHEKWDGSGYPDGLVGESIPLAARLFTLADVYDALTSNRPYRPAWSHAEALEYISKNSNLLFDPHIVPEFVQMMTE